MPGATTRSTRGSTDLPAGTVHHREAGPPTAPSWSSCTASSSTTPCGPTCPSASPTRASACSPRPGRSRRTPPPCDPGADLSPRGIARVVLSFLEAHDLRDVILVGNDTGGAVCQFVLDEDAAAGSPVWC